MATTAIYSPRAVQAVGFLKSNRNDIAIFVEDTASPNTWLKLIRKFLPKDCKIHDVTVLNGRKNVLAACRADQSRSEKRLYIIDADLDLILGIKKPNLKHLYRLRRYCLENYLLQEQALINLAMSYDVKVSESEARQSINFQDWFTSNETLLRSIFVAYGLIAYFGMPTKTVSYHVSRLYDTTSDHCCLCPQKVFKRIFSIYREIRSSHDYAAIRQQIRRLTSKAEKLQAIEFASGKDYLLPSIYTTMKRRFKFSVKIEVFAAQLADHASSSIDPYLKRRLLTIIGN